MKMCSKIIFVFSLLLFWANPGQAGGVPSSDGEADNTDLPPWEKPSNVDLNDPERIAAGEMTFQSTCADYCHGKEPASFINRDDLAPVYVYKTIYDGGKGATPMPPWGGILTNDEIWELVAYIKYLGTTE